MLISISTLLASMDSLELQAVIGEATALLVATRTVTMVNATNYTLTRTEQAIVRDGNLIGAIRAYKERTGCGLRDSKDACDHYFATMTLAERAFAERLREFRNANY